MALTLVTVTGTVLLPDGQVPSFGTLIFAISGWAKDAPHIFAPDPVEVAVGLDGTFSTSLQSTDEKEVLYLVALRYRRTPVSTESSLVLGHVEVGAPGPLVLANLLPVPVSSVSAAEALTFKRGDTISVGVLITTRYGRAQDLTGLTIESGMLGPDGVRRPLYAAIAGIATAGRVELSMSASLSAVLPLGDHRVDVKRRSGGGFVRRSPTFVISVIEEITS